MADMHVLQQNGRKTDTQPSLQQQDCSAFIARLQWGLCTASGSGGSTQPDREGMALLFEEHG